METLRVLPGFLAFRFPRAVLDALPAYGGEGDDTADVEVACAYAPHPWKRPLFDGALGVLAVAALLEWRRRQRR